MIAVRGSVKAAVDAAARRLAGTSTQTPWLDAEVLMGFVLAWSRSRLFAHWDEGLEDADLRRYETYVDRRAAGEPVAYIRNLKEFLGLELYVDPRVLIPRPETELLATRAVAWLQSVRLPPWWERLGEGTRPVVVDVGTGSGAVAIGILQSCPQVRLIATDVSAEALEVARLNAGRHGVAPTFEQGSLLEPVAGPVDLIVANLPYLSRNEYESLLGTSIAYEPRQALTDDADGLRWFAALLDQAAAKLSPSGCILLEIGSGQPAAIRRLAQERLPAFRGTIHPDLAGLPRVLELSR
ncbi:MAG TPA: peptide chain release factor N(5)-glutamine methyltransferase [Chloroflexota bacterium]